MATDLSNIRSGRELRENPVQASHFTKRKVEVQRGKGNFLGPL